MATFRMRDGTGEMRLKFITEDVDRHGNVRLYVRRPGMKKVRLRQPTGTDAFMQEYKDALAGKLPVETRRHVPAPPGTLRWLCEQYYRSEEFLRLDDRTKRVRRGIIDGMCRDHGSKPWQQLEPQHVRAIRQTKADKPEAANGMLKALRQVYAFAMKHKNHATNPAAAVEYIKTATEGFHTWTVEEVEQYEAHFPIGTSARLALALLLYTGQRRSDVVGMGPGQVRAGSMSLTQVKNRRNKPVALTIPVLPELKKVLDGSPKGGKTFLVTEFGKPFTSNGFGNRFRKWCDEAGLPHCSAHGLRKAGATIAAENGATDRQLMSIFGWTNPKMPAHYTRKASQKKLAESAMHMLVHKRKKTVPPKAGTKKERDKKGRK